MHIPAKADYLNKTNTFVTGNVRYELTDHRGNVMAVVSDKKIAFSLEQVCDGNDNCWNIVSGYTPDVISATDYAPFGMSLSGRKFNGGEYRFGFNGQMKDHDIDANGNHYTAEFWEYSADLGRRWNLDPKPNVSFSSYATFNDNPIWFSDPKGDTAGIRINRRQEVKYVGGQWIDSRTRNVVNTNDVRNSGVRRLMNDYNTLNSISEFNPVTSKINSAKNDIKLSPTAGSSTGGSETNTPKYFADLARGIAHPAINVNSIANDNIDYSLFEGGKRHDIPSYVKLGHELGHVHDILSTTPSTANFTQISGATPGISNSESNAMYWENILRVHTNLPLRLFYNNNGAALEYPANVTIGTMTIKGGKLDIKTNKITPLEIGTPILLQGLRGTPSSNFFRKAKL